MRTNTTIASAAGLLAAYARGERDFLYRVRLPWCANLMGANLMGANLMGADLTSADLTGADLGDASLMGASLRGASLRGANLMGADLMGADLGGANLRGAGGLTLDQLRTTRTAAIRADLYGYLQQVPHEVPGLLRELEAGRIDGSLYDGACACLAGTCERLAAAAAGATAAAVVRERLRKRRDAHSLRERWFLAIRAGDTPETNAVAALTAEWLRDEWLAAKERMP